MSTEYTIELIKNFFKCSASLKGRVNLTPLGTSRQCKISGTSSVKVYKKPRQTYRSANISHIFIIQHKRSTFSKEMNHYSKLFRQ